MSSVSPLVSSAMCDCICARFEVIGLASLLAQERELSRCRARLRLPLLEAHFPALLAGRRAPKRGGRLATKRATGIGRTCHGGLEISSLIRRLALRLRCSTRRTFLEFSIERELGP